MIPVTLLTGFLGSGKTTLLNRLLRYGAFARTAVIVNEFGEIGVDHDLVEASTDSVIELSTGCLCCKVRDDLARTLLDLVERRDAGTVVPFTRVVVETSGLADPAPILHTLMTDTALASRLLLSGVVTTIDAVNGNATLAREPVSVRQAAVADRLVLTKSDLLQGEPADLLDRLLELNPAARLADARSLEPHVLLKTDSEIGCLAIASSPAHHSLHAHHDADIKGYAIVRDRPMRAATLALFMEALAEHGGAALLRLKGIVGLLESPDRPAVIHGVQSVFHAPTLLARWPSADRRTRIVVIARAVPRPWIEALIEALEAEVAEVSAPA